MAIRVLTAAVGAVGLAVGLGTISAGAASAAAAGPGAGFAVGRIHDVSSCAGQNAEVEQAVDARLGYVYEVWMGCRGIAVARSVNGGRSFEAPVRVPGTVGSNVNTWDPAVAVAPDGTVYVSFMLAHGGQWYPVVDASFNHGAAFTQSSSLIPPDPKNWGDRDFIAVGPDGTVYVTWDYGPERTSVTSICASNGSCAFLTGDLNVVLQKSTDGGKTWSAPVFVATINEHGVSGGMRALPLIGAQIDASGKVYVVWADCSFRANCSSNDILMSTSTDGTTWTAPARIPIDPVKSAIDHFTPGLGIEPGTSGSSAHLALTFDGLLQANCSTNCNLGVGYISSPNGGASWTAPKILAKGINPNWLASTSSGQMLGDYNGASYPGTKAHAVFATAKAPVGATFNEPMDTNAAGLPLDSSPEPLFSSAHDKPVPNAHSQVRRTKPHRDDGVDER